MSTENTAMDLEIAYATVPGMYRRAGLVIHAIG